MLSVAETKMQAIGYSGLEDLEAQAANKEREWKDLQARRIHLLEDSLRKAEEECLSLRQQNQKLKEDFQYNLSILEERDRELERYDAISSKAVTMEMNRQEELSRLQIQVAILQAKDAEARQQQLSSQNKSAQHKLQLEELTQFMTGKIQKHMEEHDRVKLELQHRIQDLEGELTRHRQEMTTAMDKELREKGHEFNLKLDEMHAVLLSKDLKMKLLSKENEIQSQAKVEAKEVLKASEEVFKQLQAQLQQKERVMEDVTTVKDVRIKELEDKLKQMQNKLKKKEADHIRKNKDMVQALKEKEKQLDARCQAHREQLQKAEERMVKLQEDMEVTSTQAHSAHKDMQMALDEKNGTIKRLRLEVDASQTACQSYMSQASSEMVAKDAELMSLRENNDKLKAELERSTEDINRYKQDVSAGLKREADLEESRVQVELEWQRRYDVAEAKYYLANEQLIQDLTRARDQAKAELSEKEAALQGLTAFIPSVEKEQDKTSQDLMSKTDDAASEKIRSLMEQNSMLRAVVSQMRKDMEDLSALRPHRQTSSTDALKPPTVVSITSATDPPAKHSDISANTAPAVLSDYTEALKQEVSLLKAQCGQLERKLQGVSGLSSQVPAESLAHISTEKPHPHNQESKTGPCLEKHAGSTFWRTRVLRGLHADPTDQVQDENLYLWRQQHAASSLMTDVACGNVESIRRKITLVHARLRQAVAYIAHLSREKQQLIRMGNCLRARIAADGRDVVEEKKDCVPMEEGHQHDRLSAVEQLQYKLTTQELQYAVRQMAYRASERAGPTVEGAGDLWSRGPNTPDGSGTCKVSDQSPAVSLEVKMASGSEDSLPSLKEIWEILDHGLSSSLHSEGESHPSRTRATQPGGSGVTVAGTSAPIHRRPSAELQQRKNPSKAPSKNLRHKAPDRIRNYNVKD
nr:coiled-coil domain-containing protein 57-like isoform X2 [Doryrhamphus excisus]XP_057918628.1 coiled-coil domain-containing protein 57-like isoform X2 [Doryrhamphus excisus]